MFEPSEPQDQPAESSGNGSDRRAGIRYPRRLEMLWQFLGYDTHDLTTARVFDLSEGGVGLRVNRAFPPGTCLMLRLPSATHGWGTHLVRVRHCEELQPGQYHAGCAFVRPLKPDELAALLV